MRPGRSPTAPSRRRAGRGFTLVELLTVVSIVAILVAVAAPSFGAMLAAQRVHAADVGAERVAVARPCRGHQAKHRRRLLGHRSASGLDDRPIRRRAGRRSWCRPASARSRSRRRGAARCASRSTRTAGSRWAAAWVQSATSTPASTAASSSRPPAAPPRRRDRAHDAPRSPPAWVHPIEVMVTLLMLAGPARGARPAGARRASEFESYQRGQALTFARDMEARMRSARGITPGYLDPTISSVDGSILGRPGTASGLRRCRACAGRRSRRSGDVRGVEACEWGRDLLGAAVRDGTWRSAPWPARAARDARRAAARTRSPTSTWSSSGAAWTRAPIRRRVAGRRAAPGGDSGPGQRRGIWCA